MPYPDVYPDAYPGGDTPRPDPRTEQEFIYYTLDENLRRDQVIEDFESVIWTERYQAAGDITIVMKSTYSNKSLLAPGTRVGKEGSTYVMVIDTMDDDTSDDGSRNVTFTGKSFEFILNDRVAMPALSDLNETPAWVVTGTPGDIARQMFHEICVFCVLSSKDTIPFFTEGTLLPEGNIPEPGDSITISAAPDTLYNTIQKVCLAYGLGFRFAKEGDLGHLYFEIYTGSDRTTGQTDVDAIVFSPDLDNLSQIRQLTSTSGVKTVAYVFSANGAEFVYAPSANQEATGADRKVLFVNSSNSADAGPDLTAALKQEGLIALGDQREVYAFDGQLAPDAGYIYGVDYHLGDLVEEQTAAGFGNLMVVTEQIFVSDDQGDRTYPTLSINQAIVPGSWTGYAPDTWAETPDSVLWNNV